MAEKKWQRRLRRLPTKARASLVFALGALATIALDRILKLLVPEGQEGKTITGLLQKVRDVVSEVPTGYLVVIALTAFLLYAWDERERWIDAIRGWARRWRTPAVAAGDTLVATGILGQVPKPSIQGTYNPDAAPIAPPAPRTPSTYEVEQKLIVLDRFLRMLRGVVKDLVQNGPRLPSSAWNAFKRPEHNDGYFDALMRYRDGISLIRQTLEELHAKHAEYTDIVAATSLPSNPTILSATENFLVTFQYLSTYLKADAPSEVFNHIMGHRVMAMEQAQREFLEWQKNAIRALVNIRIGLSQ